MIEITKVSVMFFSLFFSSRRIKISSEFKNINIMTESIMEKDQMLFSIRRGGKDLLGYVEVSNGKLVTSGYIGENKFDNFVELIKYLQGFDIHINDFYW